MISVYKKYTVDIQLSTYPVCFQQNNLQNVKTWNVAFISLSLNFLIFKMEVTVLISQKGSED